MLFWSIRSVVLSAKDNKIRRPARSWLAGPGERGRKYHFIGPVLLPFAVDHISLAAIEEGLGTCWIGALTEDQVKRILGIPENIRVAAMLALGYPA